LAILWQIPLTVGVGFCRKYSWVSGISYSVTCYFVGFSRKYSCASGISYIVTLYFNIYAGKKMENIFFLWWKKPKVGKPAVTVDKLGLRQ
jgi:hypothetical protein